MYIYKLDSFTYFPIFTGFKMHNMRLWNFVTSKKYIDSSFLRNSIKILNLYIYIIWYRNCSRLPCACITCTRGETSLSLYKRERSYRSVLQNRNCAEPKLARRMSTNENTCMQLWTRAPRYVETYYASMSRKVFFFNIFQVKSWSIFYGQYRLLSLFN